MNGPKNPYQTLGVPRSATQAQIKEAFRELAKKHHPDRNPGNKEAERAFKEVNEAYQRVGDPESRAKYDRGDFEDAKAPGGYSSREPFHQETYTNQDFGGAGFDEDLYETIFGQARGRDQLYRMDVDFRDSVLGAEKEITLPSGKRLSVRIPPGLTDGTRLRFAGQGQQGRRGSPGDAYVEIHVTPDPRFKREGDDLVTDLSISIDDAILGGESHLRTLDGEIAVRIPPGSSTGKRLRIPGKGSPNRATKKRGDLYVELKIVLPLTIDSELKEALRQWRLRRMAA